MARSRGFSGLQESSSGSASVSALRQRLTVVADAWDTGVCGVLLHHYSDGMEKSVFHLSKLLTTTQRIYLQTKKEALAVVNRLRKFVWSEVRR